jgi:hypothetical protein
MCFRLGLVASDRIGRGCCAHGARVWSHAARFCADGARMLPASARIAFLRKRRCLQRLARIGWFLRRFLFCGGTVGCSGCVAFWSAHEKASNNCIGCQRTGTEYFRIRSHCGEVSFRPGGDGHRLSHSLVDAIKMTTVVNNGVGAFVKLRPNHACHLIEIETVS